MREPTDTVAQLAAIWAKADEAGKVAILEFLANEQEPWRRVTVTRPVGPLAIRPPASRPLPRPQRHCLAKEAQTGTEQGRTATSKTGPSRTRKPARTTPVLPPSETRCLEQRPPQFAVEAGPFSEPKQWRYRPEAGIQDVQAFAAEFSASTARFLGSSSRDRGGLADNAGPFPAPSRSAVAEAQKPDLRSTARASASQACRSHAALSSRWPSVRSLFSRWVAKFAGSRPHG